MKVKATRGEIRECVENAFMRLINEGKTFQKAGKQDNEFAAKKKSPKHGKMGPVKKEKYKNYLEDED